MLQVSAAVTLQPSPALSAAFQLSHSEAAALENGGAGAEARAVTQKLVRLLVAWCQGQLAVYKVRARLTMWMCAADPVDFANLKM